MQLKGPVNAGRYPAGETQLQRWLLDYIDHAFKDVHLDDGMTIYEGESIGMYGAPEEDAKATTAERIDWRRVPVPDLYDRSSALCYLDYQSLRFYTPAIMTIIIRDEDERGLLTDSFLFHLHDIRKSCLVGDKTFGQVYNSIQRAAIIRFLKYLLHNVRGGYVDDALVKMLDGLKRCAQQASLHSQDRNRSDEGGQS